MDSDTYSNEYVLNMLKDFSSDKLISASNLLNSDDREYLYNTLGTDLKTVKALSYDNYKRTRTIVSNKLLKILKSNCTLDLRGSHNLLTLEEKLGYPYELIYIASRSLNYEEIFLLESVYGKYLNKSKRVTNKEYTDKVNIIIKKLRRIIIDDKKKLIKELENNFIITSKITKLAKDITNDMLYCIKKDDYKILIDIIKSRDYNELCNFLKPKETIIYLLAENDINIFSIYKISKEELIDELKFIYAKIEEYKNSNILNRL